MIIDNDLALAPGINFLVFNSTIRFSRVKNKKDEQKIQSNQSKLIPIER